MMASPRIGLVLLMACVLSHCASWQQGNGLVRVRHPVDQAAAAWRALAVPSQSAAQKERALARYRQAVKQVVLDLARTPPAAWGPSVTVEGAAGPWTVTVDTGKASGSRVWRPGVLDGIVFRKPPHEPHAPEGKELLRPGLGIPLLGVRKPRDTDTDRKFIPEKGQYLPLTAVLDFQQPDRPVLRLYDPREVRSLQAGGQNWQLAADVFTPVHESLQPKHFVRATIGGLVRPGGFIERNGLFLMEPYRPDKVPVIFVHGLMADPHIWEEHAAALMSDPDLGPRVQCWYFVYPTGAPLLASSGRFRESLAELKACVKAGENGDAGFSRTLVVGHSMGGVIARMQVIDSGDLFWNTWFARLPDDLPMDPAVRAALVKMLYFESNPDIERIIFMNTPHGGSEMAGSWLGKWGSSFIQVPGQVLQLATSALTLDAAAFNPRHLKLQGFGVDGINSLTPDHPVIKTLQEPEIEAQYHSIIGALFETGELAGSSDGVVPYQSAHLPGARSEKVVPYWHGKVENRQTIQEIKRIVRLHILDARGQDAKRPSRGRRPEKGTEKATGLALKR